MESPGRKARRKKNKGRSRYGPGPAELRKRQALSRQEFKGGLCRGGRRGTGVIRELLRVGCPMEGCGEWVTDLRGHCVLAHIPEVFRDLGHTGEDIGRVRASALQTILRVLGDREGTCLATRQDC